MLVGLKRISIAFGLFAATASAANAQGTAPTANQATADAVASTLRASRALTGCRIAIETREGEVTLRGVVANAGQKAEAISLARTVQGVKLLYDGITVSDQTVRPAQYQEGMPGGYAPAPGPGGYAPGACPPGGPGDGGPVPEGGAGVMGRTQASAPGMPNYAWPSYAPYPNFSAVGYPTAYPWQAWPNIGPPSPYPEVPLDWRAVTLRWDCGIWWLDFKNHYTRPFFVPYPFGLMGY
jgi:hypothetical protein